MAKTLKGIRKKMEKQQLKLAVRKAMERVNELLLDENALPCDEGTVLLGDGAQLDSMGFVNFMIALEDELAERTGLVLNLAEELNSRNGAIPGTMTAADLVNFLANIANESKLCDQTNSRAH